MAWQDRTALASGLLSTDEVLVRDISDTTDDAAGTVKRTPVSLIAALAAAGSAPNVLSMEDAAVLGGGSAPAGDGVTDDTVNVQAAVEYTEANGLILVPTAGKDYFITSPLITGTTVNGCNVWLGSHPFAANGPTISGNFNGPLVRTAGTNTTISYNTGTRLWDHAGAVSGSNGCRMIVEGIRFEQSGSLGSCMQLYNLWPGSSFRNCFFGSDFAGVLILQGFNWTMEACDFQSSHFGTYTLEDEHYWFAPGFAGGGHGSVTNCSIVGFGCGAFLQGGQCEFSARIESCGLGAQLGTAAANGANKLLGDGPGAFDLDVFGDGRRLSNSAITLYLEACNTFVSSRWVGGVTINLNITPTGGPRYGVEANPRRGLLVHSDSFLHVPQFSGLAASSFESGTNLGRWVGTGDLNGGVVDWGPGGVKEIGDNREVPSYSGHTRIYSGGSPATFTLPPDLMPGSYGTIVQGTSGGFVTIAAGTYTPVGDPGPTSAAGQSITWRVQSDGTTVVLTRSG